MSLDPPSFFVYARFMRVWRQCALAMAASSLAACRHAPPTVGAAPPVAVESVRLEGFDVLPAATRENLERELPIRAGDTLTDKLEQTAGERAVEILQNSGYPYGQVSLAREPIDATHSRIVMRAQPGTLGYFGRINIAGNRRKHIKIDAVTLAAGECLTRHLEEHPPIAKLCNRSRLCHQLNLRRSCGAFEQYRESLLAPRASL